MNSKMNTIVIAALFLVLFTSMMQMNGVEAAKYNRSNRKLRGAENNNNEVDEQVVPVTKRNDGGRQSDCADCCGAVIAAECCSFCGQQCFCSF